MFEVINITNEFGVEFTSSLPQQFYENGRGYFKIKHQIWIWI